MWICQNSYLIKKILIGVVVLVYNQVNLLLNVIQILIILGFKKFRVEPLVVDILYIFLGKNPDTPELSTIDQDTPSTFILANLLYKLFTVAKSIY